MHALCQCGSDITEAGRVKSMLWLLSCICLGAAFTVQQQMKPLVGTPRQTASCLPTERHETHDIKWCSLPHLSLWQSLDVLLCLLAVDEGQVTVRWRPQSLDDELELIYVVLASKQGLALQQLC